MKNIEYMERARTILQERREDTESSTGTERIVNESCRQKLADAGVTKPGQMIRINKGRHIGLTAPIETIVWSECAVLLKGCGTWFDLWTCEGFFTVLDPPTSRPTPQPARTAPIPAPRTPNPIQDLATGAASPLSPSDPAPRSSSSTTPSEARKSASSRPAPSWIPQKRS